MIGLQLGSKLLFFSLLRSVCGTFPCYEEISKSDICQLPMQPNFHKSQTVAIFHKREAKNTVQCPMFVELTSSLKFFWLCALSIWGAVDGYNACTLPQPACIHTPTSTPLTNIAASLAGLQIFADTNTGDGNPEHTSCTHGKQSLVFYSAYSISKSLCTQHVLKNDNCIHLMSYYN